MELFAYHGLSLYILVTGLGHTRQLLKTSDCSLTTSKSAKLRTKLAVLIITHRSSCNYVACIIIIRPCTSTVYELPARAQDYSYSR